MSKRIAFALASPIIRPNGIVTFVTESAKILRKEGHTVDLITDAKPSISLNRWFDKVIFDDTEVEYPIEYLDGKPHINYLPQIQNRIHKAYFTCEKYDIVVGNDVQSTAAFLNEDVRLVHYIHTGALLGENTTFLSDSYVQLEREIMSYCEVAGPHSKTIHNAGSKKGHVIHLPLENKHLFCRKVEDKTSGLLFVGEGTYRKGADIFENICADLDLEAKIIASSLLDVTFSKIKKKTIKRFAPHEVEEKASFIRSAKAGFHPARCETFGYGILEMLCSMPVVLNAEHKWTEPHTELGATVVSSKDMPDAILKVMSANYKHSSKPVFDYLNEAPNTWRRFINS